MAYKLEVHKDYNGNRIIPKTLIGLNAELCKIQIAVSEGQRANQTVECGQLYAAVERTKYLTVMLCHELDRAPFVTVSSDTPGTALPQVVVSENELAPEAASRKRLRWLLEQSAEALRSLRSSLAEFNDSLGALGNKQGPSHYSLADKLLEIWKLAFQANIQHLDGRESSKNTVEFGQVVDCWACLRYGRWNIVMKKVPNTPATAMRQLAQLIPRLPVYTEDSRQALVVLDVAKEATLALTKAEYLMGMIKQRVGGTHKFFLKSEPRPKYDSSLALKLDGSTDPATLRSLLTGCSKAFDEILKLAEWAKGQYDKLQSEEDLGESRPLMDPVCLLMSYAWREALNWHIETLDEKQDTVDTGADQGIKEVD